MDRPSLLWTWEDVTNKIPELQGMLESFADAHICQPTRQEMIDLIGQFDIVAPQLDHEVDAEVIDAGQRLRIVATPSTGTDHIDIAHLARRGIELISIKEDTEFLSTVQATAELAWLLILSSCRNMRAAMQQVSDGGWDRQAVEGHELIGRTIGIVGYGRLGTMMGRIARGFRMNVIATDPLPVSDDWVRQMPLDELLAQADIITIHVHLNDETRGMFGREQFDRIKPGAVLVNTSRGGLIDEAALIDTLASGRLAAAGLDVIQGERDPDRPNRPLLQYAAQHHNLTITPHMGGCTFESQSKAFAYLINKVKHRWQQLHGA